MRRAIGYRIVLLGLWLVRFGSSVAKIPLATTMFDARGNRIAGPGLQHLTKTHSKNETKH